MRFLITKIFVMVLALTIFTSSAISAQKKKVKKYKLPNGKVLINPYVISNNPEYLEVGHNNGIIKVYLKDLPEKIQKKYNYSPEKAKKYQKEQVVKKKSREKRATKEAKKKKVQDEKFRRYRRDTSMENLEINIKKTENRIAELKREIPKLEANQNNFLDKSTSMASTSVAGSNSGGSNYNSWGGGFSYSSNSNTAGNRAERTKQRQISKVDDAYAMNKHRLKTYKKELANKEVDLMKMQNHMKKIKNQKANEKSSPKK
jgi:hypothetical protein